MQRSKQDKAPPRGENPNDQYCSSEQEIENHDT